MVIFISILLGLFSCTSNNSEKKLNTLTIPITNIPDLETIRGADVNASKINDNVFEHLVNLDSSLSPIPEIASKWTIDNKSKQIEFVINNKKLHDGSKITTTDIRNLFFKLYERKSDIVSQIKSLNECQNNDSCEGFLTLDNSRFRVSLENNNFNLFLKKLASPEALLIKKTSNNFYGSGPYKIKKIVNNNIIISKFDDRAFFDQINFKKVNPQEEQKLFSNGALDIIDDIDFPVEEKLLPSKTHFVKKVAGTYSITFSFKRPFFRKKQNRQAIAMAIDPDAFQKHLNINSIAAGGMIPIGYLGHTNVRHTLNLNKAKKILCAEKQKTLTLVVREKFRGNKAIENYLTETFQQIGLTLKLDYEPFNLALKKFRDGQADMILKGDSPKNFDSSTSFDGYVGEIAYKFSGYSNKEFQKTLKKYEAQTSDDKKIEYLANLEQIFSNEIPGIPIFYSIITTYYQSYLKINDSNNLSLKFWDFSVQNVVKN